MNREGHKNVQMFIGPEVEQTPAFGKKTLFVVGKQDLATIESIARTHKIQHIFMGANHSFEADIGDASTTYWKDTVTKLLDKGFWVTIDYPAHKHDVVQHMFSAGVWQSRLFIPMLRVCIPNLQTSSMNLVVKFDDIDFKATNPGVWVMHYHQVCDSNRFTDWQDYGTDVVIQRAVEIQPSDVVIPPRATIPIVPMADKKTVADKRITPIRTSSVVVDTNPMGLDVDATSALNDNPESPKPPKRTEKNDQTMGLDPDSTSKLKPEVVSEETINGVVVDTTPVDVAEAYAKGAKEDPLGKKGVAKPKGNKKAST